MENGGILDYIHFMLFLMVDNKHIKYYRNFYAEKTFDNEESP